MASVEETTKLVDCIVRLRRAGRVAEVADDVATVRRVLESRVGPTLSRSGPAAHPWRQSNGAGPLGGGGQGADRRHPPRPARGPAAVRGRAPRGDRQVEGPRPHATSAGRCPRRASRCAARIAAGSASKDRGKRLPRGHRTAERRSLAYHQAVAGRLDRGAIAEARARVDRLADEGHLHPRYVDLWREILALPRKAIAERIVQDSQEGRDLRQNSPFAGVLNEQERRRIIETVR